MSYEWLKELSEEDRLRAIKESFGKVAATADGEVVFRVIFEVGFLMGPIDTEEQRIRHNQSWELLQWFPEAERRMYMALLQRNEE